MRGSPRDPRNYELMTVFAPDIPEEEIQTTIDRVVGYITTATGEVTDVNRDSPWGRRRLAYPIRHASRDVRDGFYTLYHFVVAPHRVDDIEREIKLNDRIMRHMVTQYTPRPIDESAPATEGEGEQAKEGAEGEAPVAATLTPVASADEAPAVEADAPVAEAVAAPVADAEAATEAEAEVATEPEPEVAAAEPAAAAVEETAAEDSADDGAGTDEATPPEEA